MPTLLACEGAEKALLALEELQRVVEQHIESLLTEILHSSKFRQLEARWRGLRLLCETVETHLSEVGESIEIWVWHVHCQVPIHRSHQMPEWAFEIWDDLDDAKDLIEESELYRKIYTDHYNKAGNTPFSLIICDEEFHHHPEHVKFLRRISEICARAFVPFVAGLSPEFFRMSSFDRLPTLVRRQARGNSPSFSPLVNSDEYHSWQAFRNSPDACYIGLALPRLQLRSAHDFSLRFGKHATEVESWRTLIAEKRLRTTESERADLRKRIAYYEQRLGAIANPVYQESLKPLIRRLRVKEGELTEVVELFSEIKRLKLERISSGVDGEPIDDDTRLDDLEDKLALALSRLTPYLRYRERRRVADDALLGNASLGFAAVVLRAFARTGWLADIHGIPQTGDRGGLLPLASNDGHDPPGEHHSVPLPLTEFVFSDTMQKKLAGELGLLCLTHRHSTSLAGFCTTPSLHDPGAGATTSQRMASLLHYRLCVCRFAHYVKTWGHELVGSMRTAQEVEDALHKWLVQFKLDDGDAHAKARQPLKNFDVKVRPTSNAGHYRCELMLEPHHELDTIQVNLTTEFQARE